MLRKQIGRDDEEKIQEAVKNSKYQYQFDALVGKTPYGGRHRVDIIVKAAGKDIPVSVKVQHTQGTADEKVAMEIIRLINAINNNGYPYAYLVLAGEGWRPKLLDFYLNNKITDFYDGGENVIITTSEQFIELVKRETV